MSFIENQNTVILVSYQHEWTDVDPPTLRKQWRPLSNIYVTMDRTHRSLYLLSKQFVSHHIQWFICGSLNNRAGHKIDTRNGFIENSYLQEVLPTLSLELSLPFIRKILPFIVNDDVSPHTTMTKSTVMSFITFAGLDIAKGNGPRAFMSNHHVSFTILP